MKFCLIFVSLLCFNFLHAQEEEEEYVTHEEYNASNIVEGGMQYFIPQSDFARKSPDAVLGGEFTYLRRIYNSGLFLGLNFSFRSLDQFTIDDFQPLLDIETKVNNNNIAVLGRFYPELYLSIFEFFAEGGVGMNTIKAFSRDFDQVDQVYFNEFTNNIDRKVYFQGGVGFHAALEDSWYLTGKISSWYGTTVELYSKKDDLSQVEFSEDAFEFKEATYRATAISLSLSFIF